MAEVSHEHCHLFAVFVAKQTKVFVFWVCFFFTIFLTKIVEKKKTLRGANIIIIEELGCFFIMTKLLMVLSQRGITYFCCLYVHKNDAVTTLIKVGKCVFGRCWHRTAMPTLWMFNCAETQR